ncbi:DUF4435 domain-containing protein [Pseudomonas fulva]|uniref:DUF4435 domain-containing protein n=1 Tax=Pseudomonas fulva TaxID=47880 RepID=UPI0032EC7D51
MSSYSSIASYLLAVKLRTKKTLLVEGATDKKIISHFILKKNFTQNTSSDYCIDDASLVDDKTIGPIGAKQKILNIASKLNVEKFRCLVDREWDGFETSSFKYKKIGHQSNTYVTKGHSIENYWFTSDSFILFIIHTHPTLVSEHYLQAVSDNYVAILQFSAAYSLACRDYAILTRADEMISYENLDWENNQFKAKKCIDTKITERGLSCDLSGKVNEYLSFTTKLDEATLQWMCHGHLGEQAIRACIGRLALQAGYEHSTIKSITHGFKTEKLKLDADHVTSLPEERCAPLPAVLEWIRGTTSQ